MLSVLPDGKVISCAHDFEAVTDFGNLFTDSVDNAIINNNRKKKQHEHYEGWFAGLCKDCNYNTSQVGKFKYIK
jgi:radical SAM protein with 4Fe4S-binding SPASM domain